MHRWRLIPLTRHAQLHYETDVQNMGRRTKDSFHVPATGKEGRHRRLSKKGEEECFFCACPTKGRLLHDTTDKGWEKPVSIRAAAEVKGNPSHSLKCKHRSQGTCSVAAKESTVARNTDFQGVHYLGFEQHGRTSNSYPPNLSGRTLGRAKALGEGGTAASRRSGGDTSPAG